MRSSTACISPKTIDSGWDITLSSTMRHSPCLCLFLLMRNGRVIVATKSVFNHESARHLLNREAKIYNTFSRHSSEDWCGFNPAGPVVPKFYGYYVPVEMEDGKEVLRDDEKDYESPSPILLMEECGKPVKPEKFTADQRYVSIAALV